MYRCFQNFLLGFFYLSSHPDRHDPFIWKVVRLIWKKKDITGRNFDIPGGVCAISSSMEHLRLDLFSGNSGNRRDRKSTRLNSSHVAISYAVFCLKKKTTDR